MMKKTDLDCKLDWNSLAHFEPDFHGGALISEDGSETPITEKMIQSAFAALISDWESGHGGPRSKAHTKNASRKKNKQSQSISEQSKEPVHR